MQPIHRSLCQLIVVLWFGLLLGCTVGVDLQTEQTSLACQDGLDNDKDGKIDCADPDCQGFTFCSATGEASPTACQDKKDNDGDGKIDCEDPDCQGFVFCQKSGENTAAACQDKIDNDGDGLIDCQDAECQGFTFCQQSESSAAACQDGLDNDKDGKIDCDDPDCKGFTFCSATGEASPTACQDKKDNDGDGKIDCEDPDCQGFTFCQKSAENTATTCQDKIDNNGDGKVDCDDPGCLAFVFCQPATEESAAACQDKIDNDKDGKVDCDDPDCWHWHFCKRYSGPPITDTWGATWDSLPRPAKSWSEAQATCQTLGARLPTATEIHRNNTASGQGSSSISSPQSTEYLWTAIATYQQGRRVIARLSDGNTSQDQEITPHLYRCIWAPALPASGFGPGSCYGPPNNPCFTTAQDGNIDKWDRPALDYAAATNECALVNGSIPTLGDWTHAIHNGLPNGTDEWNWVAKAMYWYNKNHGHANIKWKGKGTAQWFFVKSSTANVSATSSLRRFRCIGRRIDSPQVLPTPTCSGGCMTLQTRRSTLLADKQDRPKATSHEAFAACRALGGDIPSIAELTELIHAGLPNGSNAFLWASDPIYYFSNGYGHPTARWENKGNESWSYNGWGTFANLAASNSTLPYRCIWRSKHTAWPTCQPGQILQADKGTFQCIPGKAGSSGGKASSEFVDAWQSAWDGAERAAKTYADAVTECQTLGGRLPTASELYRVRGSTNPHPALPQATSNNYLWTLTPTEQANTRVALRLSNGTTTAYPESNSRFFRCIWPAAANDVLRTHNCYGPPGNECFQDEGMTIDRYHRPSLGVTAAAHECHAVGGQLPESRELMRLLHQGLPNGTRQALWLSQPLYLFHIETGANLGYATAQWTDKGTAEWDFNPGLGGYAEGTSNNHFRCIYTPDLP